MTATRQRLESSARILARIDARRQSKGDLGIFAAVEAEIISRELDELEAEWNVNLEKMRASLRRNRRSAGGQRP